MLLGVGRELDLRGDPVGVERLELGVLRPLAADPLDEVGEAAARSLQPPRGRTRSRPEGSPSGSTSPAG